MNPSQPPDLAKPQRQSAWAVVLLALRTLRQIGLVQLLVFVGFVVARGFALPAVMATVAVIGLGLFGVALLRWWRFTFVVEGGHLVVRRGIAVRQNLTIPLERVQSVSLDQKLLHRMFSLVQVTLDTAGSQHAEFVIDAVDQSVARALQTRAANHRPVAIGNVGPDCDDERDAPGGAAPLGPPETIVLRHSPGRIVAVALTQMPLTGLVLVAPILAFVDDLGQLMPFELPTVDNRSLGSWVLWFFPLVVAVLLAISVLLNLLRVILREWNLTVWSTPAGLRRDAGLLATTSVAAPLLRVQMVNVRQGLLEHRHALHTVDLATIGGADLTVPGCTSDQVADLRRLVLSETLPDRAPDQRVSRAEVFYATRNALLVGVAVVVAAAVTIGWWGLLAVVPAPAIWLSKRREVRLRRWALGSEALVVQSAFIARRRREMLLRKVNGVTVAQRRFERARGLATVRFAGAGGSISIGMVPVEVARRLRDEALHAVETDRRPWI